MTGSRAAPAWFLASVVSVAGCGTPSGAGSDASAPIRDSAAPAASAGTLRPPPAAPPVAVVPPPDDTPVEVRAMPDGISDFYLYFFRDRDVTARLVTLLGPHVASPRVEVRIRFDEAARSGHVEMIVPPGEPASRAVAETYAAHRVLDPGPWMPWFRAVSEYRDLAGSRFDMRIFSFRPAIEFAVPRGGVCRFVEAPGGPPEPALSTEVACVDARGARFAVRTVGSAPWPSAVASDRADGVDQLVAAIEAAARDLPLTPDPVTSGARR